MKNGQVQDQSNLNHEAILSQKKTIDVFAEINLKCSQHQSAFEYCCGQTCQQNAVICQDDSCKCQSYHLNCDNYFRVKKFQQKINNKIKNDTSENMNEIKINLQQISVKMLKMLDSLLDILKTFGLNNSQYDVVKLIEKHFKLRDDNPVNKEMLTGEKLFKFRQEYKQSQLSWFKDSLAKYGNILNSTKQSIQPHFQSIYNSLVNMHGKNDPNKQLQQYFQDCTILPIKDKLDENKLFTSHISYLNDIIQQNFNVRSIEQVYSYNCGDSGSQQPSYEKFIQACSDKQNLLLLVKNQYGKVYGAFSQCRFLGSNAIITTNNNSNSKKRLSFVFHLNSGKYLKLQNQIIGFRQAEMPKQIELGSVQSASIFQQPTIIQGGLRLSFSQNAIKSQIIIPSPAKGQKLSTNNIFGRLTQTNYSRLNGAQKVANIKPKAIFVQVYQIIDNRVKQLSNSVFFSPPVNSGVFGKNNLFK